MKGCIRAAITTLATTLLLFYVYNISSGAGWMRTLPSLPAGRCSAATEHVFDFFLITPENTKYIHLWCVTSYHRDKKFAAGGKVDVISKLIDFYCWL